MSKRHHTAEWARQARRCKDRDGWRCVRCGLPGRLEAHHIDPDGGDELDNLETLCRDCHVAEHKRPESPAAAAWRQLVDELL